MILTEAYFRKISGLMLPKERQALEDTLDEAQIVLKKAHGKGVELECILEVNSLITLFQYSIYNCLPLPEQKRQFQFNTQKVSRK